MFPFLLFDELADPPDEFAPVSHGPPVPVVDQGNSRELLSSEAALSICQIGPIVNARARGEIGIRKIGKIGTDTYFPLFFQAR
jgi:hypothetical protein